jgi:putative ABC transport system substrate-binding protein
MAEFGLVEDRDFEIVYRAGQGDASRVPALIAEVIALNPAVIVSSTTGLTVELKRTTNSIPIVNTTIADPVGLGFAKSIARPGGNVTGLLATSATGGKLVELLLQIVPHVTKLGILLNPTNTGNTVGYSRVKDEIARLPVTLVRVEAQTPADIEPAFQALAREAVEALIPFQDPLFNQEAKRIADLALAARLPTAYGFRFLPDAGGLMSYGGSLKARYRRVGWYVAKILQGEKAGDLPIEQQERVELLVNMKTAAALGITVPPSILARADELIE